MNQVYVQRTIRSLIVLGIIIFSCIAVFYISKIAYPFLIALTIAFLINPLVNFFERKAKFHRGLAVFVSLILIFAVFAGLISFLVAEIVSGANYLAKVVPKHVQTLVDYLNQLFTSQIIPFYNDLTSRFNSLGSGQQETIVANIENVGKQIGKTIGNFIQGFFEMIPSILTWFPSAASVVIFSLLATFFISKDWEKLSRRFDRIIPQRAKISGQTVFLDLKKALFGFIKAQATLISITAVIILIGLLILQVDYAVTIALVCGLADLLPYLGTGTIFVPWIIYEAIVGDVSLAIGLGILYTIVLVQRQIMEPKILSSNIGLDPLATLIALFIGFKLIGFLGLIVGPVTVVIITTLHRANVFKDIWKYILGDDKNTTVK